MAVAPRGINIISKFQIYTAETKDESLLTFFASLAYVYHYLMKLIINEIF